MPKERSINPAQAQRKADKQKEIRKSKQNLQNHRNEKLAQRNPDRIRKQIDDLKSLEQQGALRPKDKETLAQLERDLRGVLRAREALGDAAPTHGNRQRRSENDPRQEQLDRRNNLGKRRRDAVDAHESDTDPEVRDIPMPRDTPPPIPRAIHDQRHDQSNGREGRTGPHALPAKPVAAAPSQATYSSAPQLRDLTKESLKFVPTTVAQNKKRVQGHGQLLEPEEADRLERAGYLKSGDGGTVSGHADSTGNPAANAVQTQVADDFESDLNRLEAELGDSQQSTKLASSKSVQIEEVADEGD